jgi:hypothetical protein
MNKTVKMSKSKKAKFETNLYSGLKTDKINKPKRGKLHSNWE